MIFNSLLSYSQNFFAPFYKKSTVLQGIDFFIFANIILMILFSTFASSDSIGYFAILVIILTTIKLFTKPNERIVFSLADKFLLLYFVFVLISVAGSSLFFLSLKGFSKSLVYLGFYIGFVLYLKDNRKNFYYLNKFSLIICWHRNAFFIIFPFTL